MQQHVVVRARCWGRPITAMLRLWPLFTASGNAVDRAHTVAIVATGNPLLGVGTSTRQQGDPLLALRTDVE